MPAEHSDPVWTQRIVGAIQKVRRQKQRPTAERIHRVLEREGHKVTSSDVVDMLDHGVSSGTVERVFNASGIVSYRELANASTLSSSVAVSALSGDAEPEANKHEPKLQSKKSESPQKELKKADKKPLSKQPSSAASPPEPVSGDCKPVLVVDKHSDLSDVVLQVIVRLGSASGKAVEKHIRGHYRLDIYPGIDIRRHIRTACKSLVRQEQLRQEGNNFVLMSDDDDAADVTLTVDEPTTASNRSIETQVETCSAATAVCSCIFNTGTGSLFNSCPCTLTLTLYHKDCGARGKGVSIMDRVSRIGRVRRVSGVSRVTVKVVLQLGLRLVR